MFGRYWKMVCIIEYFLKGTGYTGDMVLCH